MRRRPARRNPAPSAGESQPGVPEETANAGAGEPVGATQWDAWEESEAERVAKWLKSKTGLDSRNGDQGAGEPEAEPPRSAPQPFLVGEAEADWREPAVAPPVEELERGREQLASAIGHLEEIIDDERHRAADAYAAVEASIRVLEQRHAELESRLAAQRAQTEQVAAGQRAARDRLLGEIANLDASRQELAAGIEEAEASTAAEQAGLHTEADRLRAEIGRLQRDNADLEAAAGSVERGEEVARLDAEAENARLAAEASRLAEEHARLTADLEATTAQAEQARQARAEERARHRAEIDAGRAATQAVAASVDAAEEQLSAARRSSDLDPTGRLAESIAALGRRFAEVLEEERAEAAGDEKDAADAEATRTLAATLEEATHPGAGAQTAEAPRLRLFRRRHQ